MGKGDVYVFMDGNSIYSLKSKKMRIYNNIITSRVIKTKIVGGVKLGKMISLPK